MLTVHADNYPTPMDWIYEARTYGFKIQFTTPTMGNLSWMGSSITSGRITLSMASLTEMMHQMVGELTRTMDELFFTAHGIERPMVDWKELYDDPGNDEVGFSFVRDSRNRTAGGNLDGCESWLVRRIMHIPQLKSRWLESTGAAYRFRTAATDEYLDKVDTFRKLLLIAAHLLGGQPPRTTELLCLRHVNSPYGGYRNVFIQHNMVCLAFSYHKGYQLSGQAKVIHRFLPQEVGLPVVLYLAFILPFAQQIQVARQEEAELSYFIWGKRLVRFHGVSSDDDAKAQLWSSDKMRRLLEDLAARHMGVKLTIGAWRHISIAIGRRYIEPSFGGAEGSYDGHDSDEEDIVVDKPIDLQAGHGSYLAGMVYGREAHQGNMGIVARQEEFRSISTRWHSFFGFGSYGQHAGRKPKTELFATERRAVRQQRLKRLFRIDLHGCLRQMFQDPNMQFRGNQLVALQAVVRGHSPILQITGTGGGKSLTFMLPSYAMGDGTTVVIVPFVALEEDLRERCRTLNISCEIWSQMEAQTASIILVTPESFVSKSFGEFLDRLLVRHELDRIVFDECHTVLDSSYEFRCDIRTIGSYLIPTGVQLVFLTATMPPRDELEFWTTLGLPASKATVVRGSTPRSNIAYSVLSVAKPHEEQTRAIQLAREAMASSEGAARRRTRVILYCRRVDQADDVAEELGCAAYHSKVGSPSSRAKLVREWMETGGAIVATSALGAGIDVPDVRFIFHIGSPRSLRDFVQESGRAGRDGLPSRSVIIVCQSRTKDHQQWVAPEKEDIGEFVRESVVCRRAVLSRVMDGRTDRAGCEEGEAPCDLCRTRVAEQEAHQAEEEEVEQLDAIRNTQSIVRRGKDWVREVTQQVDMFVRCIKFFGRNCLPCMIFLRETGSYEAHPFGNGKCKWPEEVTGRTSYQIWGEIFANVKEFRSAVRRKGGLKAYSGCFTCFAPQNFCAQWKAEDLDGGRFVRSHGQACSYDHVIKQVISTALAQKGMMDAAIKAAIPIVRRQGQWVEEDCTWEELIVVPVRWGRVQANGLCLLFLFLAVDFAQ
jgi:superfamily II DNA helicase RecQ